MGGKSEGARRGVTPAKAKWAQAVLVCGKCGKRQGLGRGEMRKRLKRAAKAREGAPRLRIAEIGCLGICPGKGIVAATGADLSRGRVRVLRPDIDGTEALAALVPPDAGPA